MNKHLFDSKRTGLARALSKLGCCSRSQAGQRILAGRVTVNGKVCRDPTRWVDLSHDRIEIDSTTVVAAQKVYLMLNKPRGLITSASDEHGRETVFSCLGGHELPPLGAVGRLDKASEGLLLFTNDTPWAARMTSPESGVEKVYHVQVDGIPTASILAQINTGVQVAGEILTVKAVKLLRQGSRNSWLAIVLTEGKNRQIRRLLEGVGLTVLRLIRIAVGRLELGDLPKGQFRYLTAEEVASLSSRGGSASRP